MLPVPVASRSALAALTFLALSTAVAGPSAFASELYSIRDLGLLPGGTWSRARGLNDRGQVVGVATRPGVEDPSTMWGVPVVFEPDGTIREVVAPGFVASGAERHGINDSGRLAGDRPVTWEERFYDINDRGQAVGETYVFVPGESVPRIRATIDGEGGRTHLGTLGGSWSEGYGINESGHVVGRSEAADGSRRAFLYRDGVMQDLTGLLGGHTDSVANAINDRGQVIGGATGLGAFLLDGDELTVLGAAGQVSVLDLNNDGKAVGALAVSPVGDSHAFLYEDGAIFDLNDLIRPETGWTLRDAYGINELGQIAGTGTLDGSERAFLLSPTGIEGPPPDPIPEPAPIALLGLVAGWAVYRRRHRGA
jgi:probable HAF family extracellular repeat protein